MEESSFQIALINKSDNREMARIIRSSLKEFNANKPGTVYFDESTDNLSQIFTKPRSAYFVIHDRGQVAGGAGIYPTEGLSSDTCELVKMYLDTSFRKKGYGSILMHSCLEKAKEFGYKKVYLETMPELKEAISFYQRTGFEFLQKPLGNSGHTGCDIWMQKVL